MRSRDLARQNVLDRRPESRRCPALEAGIGQAQRSPRTTCLQVEVRTNTFETCRNLGRFPMAWNHCRHRFSRKERRIGGLMHSDIHRRKIDSQRFARLRVRTPDFANEGPPKVTLRSSRNGT